MAASASLDGSVRRKRLLGALAVVATVVGVLSGGTSLFDWFGHKVHSVTPPPSKIDARMASPVLRGEETLGDYLRETKQATKGLSSYQLGEEGFNFLISMHIQGNLDRTLFLNWSIIDDRTGRPLSDSIYSQTAAKFRPRGPDQAREWPIWVPSPPRRGKFTLRAVMVDDKHLPLYEADSKPFTVAKAPSP